jgi:hypothetical protein
MEYARPGAAIQKLFETGFDKAVFAPIDTPPRKFQSFKDIRDKANWFRIQQQTPHHKFPLDEHTTQVITNLNQMMLQKGVPTKIRGLMNLSALFHDFGKAHQEGGAFNPEKGHWQYIGHQDVSREMAMDAMTGLAIPEEDKKFVATMVGLHMEPHTAHNWSPKRVRQFLQKEALVPMDPQQVESFKNSLMKKQGYGEAEADEIIRYFTKDFWRLVFDHAKADEMSTGMPHEEDLRVKDETIAKWEQSLQQLPPPKPIIGGGKIIDIVRESDPGLRPNMAGPRGVSWVVELGNMLLESQTKDMTPEQAADFIRSAWQGIRGNYVKEPTQTQQHLPPPPSPPPQNLVQAWAMANCRL